MDEYLETEYSGRKFDLETNGYYYGSRIYDVETGTWNKLDVYRGEYITPGTRHRYAFLMGNPVNKVDVWGYRTQEEIEEDLARTADEFNFANNQIGNIDNLIKLINESNKGWVENEVKRIELEKGSHYIWMRMLRGLGGVFESEAKRMEEELKYYKSQANAFRSINEMTTRIYTKAYGNISDVNNTRGYFTEQAYKAQADFGMYKEEYYTITGEQYSKGLGRNKGEKELDVSEITRARSKVKERIEGGTTKEGYRETMEKETKAVMDNYGTVLAKHMEEESNKRGEQRRIQLEVEACTVKGGTYADGNCTVMIKDWDKMPALNQGDYSGCIPNAGCALTSATMVMQYLGVANVTPEQMWAISDNSCAARWEALASFYKTELVWHEWPVEKAYLYDKTKEYIESGIPVILGADNWRSTGLSHYIVVIGYDNEGFLVNNPASGMQEKIKYNSVNNEVFTAAKVFQNK